MQRGSCSLSATEISPRRCPAINTLLTQKYALLRGAYGERERHGNEGARARREGASARELEAAGLLPPARRRRGGARAVVLPSDLTTTTAAAAMPTTKTVAVENERRGF